jgi:cytochrome bd ubiquinol oxidase subunit II
VVELWFALLSFMLTMFAVLDGWNFGAGALNLMVARPGAERREVIAAIGPTWSWHEVWLVAAGATFLLSFPNVMAAAFSGFYLALWLVLWSFVLRGVSIEVGGHIDDALWQSAWDFVFAGSSLLLAVLFGAALGNVIRGVPLDASGKFSMSLFTDFHVRGKVGILDWYTVSVAVFTTVLLLAHGAAYLQVKTVGVVYQRSGVWARRLWMAVLALFPIVSVKTWIVRPELAHALVQRPVAWLSTIILIGGAVTIWTAMRRRDDRRAFVGSCIVLASLLATAAVTMFPVMLHSTLAPEHSLTAYNGSASRLGLTIALVWWPIAVTLAITYFFLIRRSFGGRVATSSRH